MTAAATPRYAPGMDAAETPENDLLTAWMRLVVGAGILSAEELLRSLRRWEDELAAAGVDAFAPAPDDDSVDADLRAALLGLMFETHHQVLGGLDRARAFTSRAWQTLHMASGIIGVPAVFSFLGNRLAPLRELQRREYERLAAIGRREEQHARAMARAALAGVSDTALADLTGRAIGEIADSPKVRDLLRTQSVGIADDMLQTVRKGAGGMDDRLDRALKTIFGRRENR